MLYGGDRPGPLLTAAHANGWKMEDTEKNNCFMFVFQSYCVWDLLIIVHSFSLPNKLIHYAKKVLDC